VRSLDIQKGESSINNPYLQSIDEAGISQLNKEN